MKISKAVWQVTGSFFFIGFTGSSFVIWDNLNSTNAADDRRVQLISMTMVVSPQYLQLRMA